MLSPGPVVARRMPAGDRPHGDDGGGGAHRRWHLDRVRVRALDHGAGGPVPETPAQWKWVAQLVAWRSSSVTNVDGTGLD